MQAIITSPYCSFSIRPDFRVSSLSEMLPPYRVETNEIPPFGTIPTKAFRVLLFLYEEKVTCWASGLFGFSMYISVASMIRVVVGYFFAKTLRQV